MRYSVNWSTQQSSTDHYTNYWVSITSSRKVGLFYIFAASSTATLTKMAHLSHGLPWSLGSSPREGRDLRRWSWARLLSWWSWTWTVLVPKARNLQPWSTFILVIAIYYFTCAKLYIKLIKSKYISNKYAIHAKILKNRQLVFLQNKKVNKNNNYSNSYSYTIKLITVDHPFHIMIVTIVKYNNAVAT